MERDQILPSPLDPGNGLLRHPRASLKETNQSAAPEDCSSTNNPSPLAQGGAINPSSSSSGAAVGMAGGAAVQTAFPARGEEPKSGQGSSFQPLLPLLPCCSPSSSAPCACAAVLAGSNYCWFLHSLCFGLIMMVAVTPLGQQWVPTQVLLVCPCCWLSMQPGSGNVTVLKNKMPSGACALSQGDAAQRDNLLLPPPAPPPPLCRADSWDHSHPGGTGSLQSARWHPRGRDRCCWMTGWRSSLWTWFLASLPAEVSSAGVPEGCGQPCSFPGQEKKRNTSRSLNLLNLKLEKAPSCFQSFLLLLMQLV
ncbi:PREDICTED: uncharacterized protein LOC108505673 [Lepidothrix coronata]|uniref:Uncharacterized protein LOC108505673 n=1 Tax=Lepidothrix coronata TaxID=321398 RepID=A0A6J0ILD0_9PASS|nr:PREDICTED: uncharacterized protein LOC108505673 [Lepidothrix coronata]XP_017687417.1 PREDICTED: uncharacterized protein LOC108505673 [Lepidothrix coronata]XP_017687418.1 PREDICTED: uncharacterized protein LOC108505673 [Lepidothrix coronata]XP_017687419.1 PREDICTED: uncharacterized protein LOC108505673 [Lepidothrix coronata]